MAKCGAVPWPRANGGEACCAQMEAHFSQIKNDKTHITCNRSEFKAVKREQKKDALTIMNR